MSGANDGGSSTAILLEFANHLRGKQARRLPACWLVWTDERRGQSSNGRKPTVFTWHPSSGREVAERRHSEKSKALFVMDMIGDADLNIDRESNSTPWMLSDIVQQAAARTGYQSHFFARTASHRRRSSSVCKTQSAQSPTSLISTTDMRNVFHHTPQDTIDKLSPKSLEIRREHNPGNASARRSTITLLAYRV